MPVYPPAKSYDALFGDGTSSTLVITHGLGTTAVAVVVRDASTARQVMVEWDATSAGTVTLYFMTPPAANAYRVTVMRG